ncbi:unnamed protein product [Microthlaspi erraticum]|uniref:Arabidopsis retrotransposon Orf1 C-terminal domain-containing protein n=1 Tax=Microthlaspi erraticum TaxID=1685480 RepID=A0A6D2K9P5_9BRAS|nr:unnamed protein product [Microthlaspi erraticum]
MICEKRSLSSIELRIELRSGQESADLGEPECYYFEEYEAPRMNPSVVAAHKRIGLLQKFNKWQGKAIEKMQKSMDKMVSKIKSLEKKSLTEPLLSSQGKEKTTRREGGRVPRPDAPARPPDSIESKQRKLNSIELTVELTWRSPCLRTLDSSTIQRYQDFSRPLDPYNSFEQAQLHQGQGSHTHFDEEEEKRSRKLDRVSARGTQLQWSAPDGRLPSPDHDLASQFFGGH